MPDLIRHPVIALDSGFRRNDKPGVFNRRINIDVRDVVSAHILAGEKDCEGRFIACGNPSPTFRDIIETMHGINPKIPLPLMTMPNFPGFSLRPG